MGDTGHATDCSTRALTAKFCQGAGPGRYSDRGAPGLMLIVGKTGARSWVQRITVGGKRRDFGLGSFRTTSLAVARERATENASRVEAERFVPMSGSRRPCGPAIPSTIPTLADCLETVVAGKVAAGSWKPGSTSAQEWRRSLTNHAEALGAMRVDTVESADILAVLSPLMAGGGAAIVDRIRPRIKAALSTTPWRRVIAQTIRRAINSWRRCRRRRLRVRPDMTPCHTRAPPRLSRL